MDMKHSVAPLPHMTMQAFCEDEETRALLQMVIDDPRMVRVDAGLHQGGLPSALEAFRIEPIPNLIIIETKAERDLLFQELDALAELCEETTKVIVIGDMNDVQLYRALMARGISDYLIHPFEPADLVRAIAALYADPAQRLVGRVIAVTGAKGGCGVSTLAHNLALTMARNIRQPVILIDLDLPFGTAGLDFNQEPHSTLADAIEAPERVDSVFVERLLVRCEDNLSLLAAPAMVEAAGDLAADVFDPVLDAVRSLAPYIVLDMPHGWADWKRRLLLSSEDIVLVCEPDLANLRNAKNILEFMRKQRPNDLNPRLILNKAGMARRPEISASDFERGLALAPTAIIPHEAKLFGTAANNGQMLADTEGSAKIGELLKAVCAAVTGVGVPKPDRMALIAPLVAKLRSAFA